MKINVEFDLSGEEGRYEEERFNKMMQADRMSFALSEIWENVFRPYWKHGYDDKELEELTNLDTLTNEQLTRIIEILGDRYLQVIRANGIDND